MDDEDSDEYLEMIRRDPLRHLDWFLFSRSASAVLFCFVWTQRLVLILFLGLIPIVQRFLNLVHRLGSAQVESDTEMLADLRNSLKTAPSVGETVH